MTLRDDPAFGRVARHLERLGAGAFALYKAPCLERRLASRLRARGQPGLAAYAGLLDADEEERKRLVSTLAVGVTGFFRNPGTWQRLAAVVGPGRAPAPFAAWSAGCATGEEAYSLAMLLDRVLPPGVPWTVEGSDLDERSLETARAARYPARVLPDIAAVGPARGTVSPAGFEVAAELRARVRFRRDDLTAPAARGPFDLVLCRNVLIYFGPEGQALALASLARALAPGGLLVLGRAELPARTAAAGLAVVDARERIYRRVP